LKKPSMPVARVRSVVFTMPSLLAHHPSSRAGGPAYSCVVTRSNRQSRADKVRDTDPFGGRPPIEQIEIRDKTYVVAKVEPLDVNGVRTIAIGSALWLIAFIALLPFYSTLQDHGRGWWLWTCLAGFGLGLLGVEYCRRRRRRLAEKSAEPVESSPLGAAGL
jgi:hypothetical protein